MQAKIIFRFLKRVFWVKKEEAEAITYKEIEDSIYFYGHNLWILFFSMIIACVGLNINSPAAVIGAMLISPLMGPVIGLGFGLAIHDLKMISRSARHWLIAILISLSASTLYFMVTPLHDVTPQIASFSRATIFDAILAFFGGLAGFLGLARKDGNKVLAGVAIATACMPPLCTAGYGLATLQASYFVGGLYFYMVNCLFIGLGSLLLARYMKFRYASIQTTHPFFVKHSSTLITIVTILGIIPCVFIFLQMVREDRFKKKAEKFVAQIGKHDFAILNKNFIYKTDTAIVELTFIGSENDHQSQAELQKQLQQYVTPSKLLLHYTNTRRNVNENDLRGLIQQLQQQDSLIKVLQQSLK